MFVSINLPTKTFVTSVHLTFEHLNMQIKLGFVAGGILAAFAVVNADQCALGSVQIDGNWFCQPVQAIRYSNVGTAGSYKQIVKMGSDGKCESVPRRFSGPLSPLNEEVIIACQAAVDDVGATF